MGDEKGNGIGAGSSHAWWRSDGYGYGDGSRVGDGWGAGPAHADPATLNMWTQKAQEGSGAFD